MIISYIEFIVSRSYSKLLYSAIELFSILLLYEPVCAAVVSYGSWLLYEFEIIFTDNLSTDNSFQLVKKISAKDNRVKGYQFSKNVGKERSLLFGFQKAMGDAIIQIDCDFEDPPELIPDFVKKWEEGNEIVHTVRTKRKGEGKFRMLITKIAYKTIHMLSDINLPIQAGDYKLISKKALNIILSQKEFRPYVRGLSVWVGFKQDFVYYEREARGEGKSKVPLLSSVAINDYILGITSYSLKPLYLGIIFGFISILICILLIIYSLYLKFNGLAIPGSTSIVISISFFSGMLLFTLGIIGIYLARIFEQTKGRDQYIIKEIKDYK